MPYTIDAACFSCTGKIRKNNEDNFFFHDTFLPEENSGLTDPLVMNVPIRSGVFLAVFDGLGGENFGEAAAFAAAHELADIIKSPGRFWISRQKIFGSMIQKLNQAVLRAKQIHLTEHMGTTAAILYCSRNCAYICNVGDSRIYQLRKNTLVQLSKDHIVQCSIPSFRKAPLTQSLGLDPNEVELEPHILRVPLAKDDRFVLCSDGLTDMVTDSEIADILINCPNPQTCVESLVSTAMNHGGKDNTTAIVCNII